MIYKKVNEKDVKKKSQKISLKLKISNFLPVDINNGKVEISVWGDYIPGEYDNRRIKTPADYILDLRNQIRDDIFPLSMCTIGGAPFTSLRNLFCFLDHVARLRFGNKMDSLEKLFEEGCGFGCLDSYHAKRYRDIYKDLIQLYRHELVHHIRPFPKFRKIKVLKKNGRMDFERDQKLGFFIQSRRPTTNFDEWIDFLNKEPDKNRKEICHLRSADKDYSAFIVDVSCFLADTVDYLDRYCEVLKSQQNNFQENLNFCLNYCDIILANLAKPSGNALIMDRKVSSR